MPATQPFSLPRRTSVSGLTTRPAAIAQAAPIPWNIAVAAPANASGAAGGAAACPPGATPPGPSTALGSALPSTFASLGASWPLIQPAQPLAGILPTNSGSEIAQVAAMQSAPIFADHASPLLSLQEVPDDGTAKAR